MLRGRMRGDRRAAVLDVQQPQRLTQRDHAALQPLQVAKDSWCCAYKPCVIMLNALPSCGPKINSTASTTIATKIRIKVYSIKACPFSPDRVRFSFCILNLHPQSGLRAAQLGYQAM